MIRQDHPKTGKWNHQVRSPTQNDQFNAGETCRTTYAFSLGQKCVEQYCFRGAHGRRRLLFYAFYSSDSIAKPRKADNIS